jgi:hypothetical protein
VAPEPPVIAALAHARAMPRRRDPFGALRRDVMARPVALGGLRPDLVLAATALIVAAIGIALLGGGRGPDALPGLSAGPSMGASVEPSIAPTVGPSALPSPSASEPPPTSSPGPSGAAPSGRLAATVVLRETGGNRAWVDVVDASGHLVDARLGTVAPGQEPSSISATNLDARSVRLSWAGSPCDSVHRLTIGIDLALDLDRPKCYGDAIPAFYAIDLSFDTPVEAAALAAALHDGRLESGLPTHLVTGLDTAGDRYDLAIFDGSGRLEVPEPFSDGTQPPDPGPTGYVVRRLDDAVGRLTWRAPACATALTLRIDASASDWQIGWQPCAAPPEVLRVVDLAFDHLPDTTGINVTIGGPP